MGWDKLKKRIQRVLGEGSCQRGHASYNTRLTFHPPLQESEEPDGMVRIVNHFIENYELLNHLDNIPYTCSECLERVIINHVPLHPDGTKMKTPRELVNGYFLETSASRDEKRAMLQSLADKCSVNILFEEESQRSA